MMKRLASGSWVGDTAGLRRLQDSGSTVHCVWMREQEVSYSPRNRFDPQPWTDGTFRFRSTEVFATEPKEIRS